ncbi:MAG: radical SAM protein [Eubacterium sp.]|nr:radical SAM protein [Eubacterium sp.]
MSIDLLLINPPFHKRYGSSSMFPMGLSYIISAITAKGFSYAVVDCTQIVSSLYEENLDVLSKELRKCLSRHEPMLIGIGPCMTSEVKALKVIADVCRSMFDAERIFAGGPLAGIPGQEWVFFDYLGLQYVIKGYGETAVVRALQTVKGGQPLSKCAEVSRPGYLFYNRTAPIDTLAFPTRLYVDQTIISERRKNSSGITLPMITSRGCPYHCNYCVSGSMSKQERFHKRSVKSIVDEMEFLQKTYHVNDVIFYDDCFFFKVSSTNQEIKNFRDELFRRDIHMSWQMEIRVDWLTHIDSNGVHMLEECGCRQINVGIEKTNPLGQEYLGKAFSVGAFVDAVRLVKRHSKIRIAGTFILGGGDENQERILKEIDVSKDLGLDFAHFNPLFIYPGTNIYHQRFCDPRDWLNYILEDSLPWGEIVYENEFIDRDALIELTERAYRTFYAGTKYEAEEMVLDRFNLRRTHS